LKGLFAELNIIGAGIEVHVDEVEEDPQHAPIGVEEEGPNLM
jgi:hypothetical protein